MTNKKLEEILNKDKKFLLVMIPIILVLSLFLAYAFIPSFNETSIEDNIISLIEQSTNDTLSLLVQSDSNNDSEDIESEVVSSQNATNRGSNSGSGTTSSDTGTTTTDSGSSDTNDPAPEPVQPTPVDDNPPVNPGSGDVEPVNPDPVVVTEPEG